MATSLAFWIERVTLRANVVQGIKAPRLVRSVSIGNGTAGDVKVYSHNGGLDDSIHYLVIAAGYEREITAPAPVFGSDASLDFWLESDAGGLVVIAWL